MAMEPNIAGRTVWERMIFALTVSMTLHFLIVIGIQGKPRETSAIGSAPMTARLEPLPKSQPDVPPAEQVEQPTTAPLAEQADAKETTTSLDTAIAAPSSTPQTAAKPEPSALDIPVIRDPTYHAARFLDEYPKPLGPIEPHYPESASIGNISGSVTLLLLIDENGVLNHVSVVEAHPESIFDESAVAAFRGMLFSPARKDGRAVRSRVLVTVAFESNNRRSSGR